MSRPAGVGAARGREPVAAEAAQHRVERRDMHDFGAAAAADHGDAVLDDEAFEPLRQFGGAERVTGMAGDQFGQPGIGLHRDQPGQFSPSHLTCSAISRGPVAQLRPITGTSSASNDRRRGRDIGADQQGAGGLDRDLNQDRRIACRRPRAPVWRR